MPEKVTVITPTYNRAALLSRAMASIWKQTYRPIEVIIINDGGTDKTDDVIEEFREKNDTSIELVYHKQQTNKERNAARNFGIDKASGDYICFLDDDDEFLPDKFQRSVSFLKSHPNIDLVFSNALLDHDGKMGMYLPSLAYEGMKDHSQAEVVKRLCVGNFIPITNVMMKSAVLKANKFNPHFLTHEDYELWLRLSTKIRFDWIDEPLALIHSHTAEVRYDVGNLRMDQMNVIFEHISELPEYFHILLQKLIKLKRILTGYYLDEKKDQSKANWFLSLFNEKMEKAFSDQYIHIMSTSSGINRWVRLLKFHIAKRKIFK